MREHRRLAAAVVVVLAAAVAACSGGGDGRAGADGSTTTAGTRTSVDAGRDDGPFVVPDGAVRPAGTPLFGGLTVAAGSRLVGTTFPGARATDGSLALLLVGGDPVEVYNAYVDQADALGMTVGDGGGCLNAGGGVACSTTLVDPSDGESLAVQLVRRPSPGGFVSHAGLRYRPPGSTDPATVGAAPVVPPTSPLFPVALPDRIEPPDDANLTAAVAPFGPVVSLGSASELAAPPGPCGCAPAGWSVVLRLTGDPVAELTAYARQLSTAAVEPTTRNAGRRSVVVASIGLVPGGFGELRAVTEADGRAWLLIAFAQA